MKMLRLPITKQFLLDFQNSYITQYQHLKKCEKIKLISVKSREFSNTTTLKRLVQQFIKYCSLGVKQVTCE